VLVAPRAELRDRRAVGPVGALLTARLIEARGIDPALEEPFQPQVERVRMQPALVER
jgi:hypothetical protein